MFAAPVSYHPLLQKGEAGAGSGEAHEPFLQLYVAFRQVDRIPCHGKIQKGTSKRSQIQRSSNWCARTKALAARRTLGWEGSGMW